MVQLIGLPAVQYPQNALLDFAPVTDALRRYGHGADQAWRGDRLREAGDLYRSGDTTGASERLFRAGLPQEAMALGMFPLQQEQLRTQTAVAQQQLEAARGQQEMVRMFRDALMGRDGPATTAPPATTMAPTTLTPPPGTALTTAPNALLGTQLPANPLQGPLATPTPTTFNWPTGPRSEPPGTTVQPTTLGVTDAVHEHMHPPAAPQVPWWAQRLMNAPLQVNPFANLYTHPAWPNIVAPFLRRTLNPPRPGPQSETLRLLDATQTPPAPPGPGASLTPPPGNPLSRLAGSLIGTAHAQEAPPATTAPPPPTTTPMAPPLPAPAGLAAFDATAPNFAPAGAQPRPPAAPPARTPPAAPPPPQQATSLRDIFARMTPENRTAALLFAIRGDYGELAKLIQGQTPGTEAVDRAYAPEFANWTAAGGYADVQRQIAQLARAQRALATDPNVTGPLVGRLPDWANSLIGNERVIATRQAVEEVVQRSLRQILGAQFTENEATRLIARAYDPTLQPAENLRRVNLLLGQIAAAAEAREAASQYFRQHGTLRGWQGRMPALGDFTALFADAPPAPGSNFVWSPESGLQAAQ